MDIRSKTPTEKKKTQQQENLMMTSSISIRAASRHSVSSYADHTSSPFSPFLTHSFTKTSLSPSKGSSSTSPLHSFCTKTSCRKPSPRHGVPAWALSPGRSLDMTETTIPRRKSVDCGRVGSSMGGVMGLFARRKKPDPMEEETVHRLRIILVQVMQWRLANARADSAVKRQRFISERKLFYGWLRLAELRNVVTAKRVLLQRGRLKLILHSLLIPQVKLLMKWEQITRPHVDAVAVLGKVLGVTCLSVPLVQGAQANIVSLHKCLRVSMDIMKDIEVKAKIFYSMAETVSVMFTELAKTILLEMEGLHELMNLYQKIMLLQTEEASLRANLIQATKAEDEKIALSKPLTLHRYMTLRPMPAYLSINF